MAKKTAPVAANKTEGVAGTSGIDLIYGRLLEEYLTKLQSPRDWSSAIKEMLTDATVQLLLMSVKLPLLSADWSVQGDSEPERAFGEELLFNNPEKSWREFLTDALRMLEYGFMPMEIVSAIDEQGRIILDDLAIRHPKTVVSWIIDENDKLLGIRQQGYFYNPDLENGTTQTEWRTVDIFTPKLVVFAYNKEGANWQGQSILRACYRPWYSYDKLWKIFLSGLEKNALGYPVATMTNTRDDKAYKEKMRLILENLRAHDKQAILLPQGIELKEFALSLNAPAFKIALDFAQADILRSFAAQWMNLGKSGAGSLALSRDQSSFFLDALISVAENVCGTFNKKILKLFTDMNFTNVKAYPRLVCNNIGDMNKQGLAGQLQALVSANLLHDDGRKIEQEIRKWWGLPILTDEEMNRPSQPIILQPQMVRSGLDYNIEHIITEAAEMGSAEKSIDFKVIENKFDSAKKQYGEELDKIGKRLVIDLQNQLKTKTPKEVTVSPLYREYLVNFFDKINDNISEFALAQESAQLEKRLGKKITIEPKENAKEISRYWSAESADDYIQGIKSRVVYNYLRSLS